MFSNKACPDRTHREKSLPLEAQLCLHREWEAFSSSPCSHPVEVAGMEAGCAQTQHPQKPWEQNSTDQPHAGNAKPVHPALPLKPALLSLLADVQITACITFPRIKDGMR